MKLDLRTCWPPAVLPVLEGHLQRDLDRGRAGVRVEDPVEARRRQLDQARRQLGRAGVGEAEHGGVGDSLELVANGLVDQRVAMAVDVAPQRRDAVQVAAPVGVDQLVAPGPLDHQRLLADPVPLLGERMPHVKVIELGLRAHQHRENSSRVGWNRWGQATRRSIRSGLDI